MPPAKKPVFGFKSLSFVGEITGFIHRGLVIRVFPLPIPEQLQYFLIFIIAISSVSLANRLINSIKPFSPTNSTKSINPTNSINNSDQQPPITYNLSTISYELSSISSLLFWPVTLISGFCPSGPGEGTLQILPF